MNSLTKQHDCTTLQYLSLLMITVCLQACHESTPKALGTLEWDRLNGRAVASEVIVEIYVEEGQLVKQHTPLLKLDDSLQQAHVRQLEAGVEELHWRLRQLESGYRSEEIASAKAELEAASTSRKNIQLNYQRQKDLRFKNLNSQRQLDDAKSRYDQAIGREEMALQKLKELQSGYRREEIEQAKASYSAKQAQLAYEQGLLSRYTIMATRQGKVDSLPYKLGDKPPAHAVLTTLLAGDKPWARVYLPETWLSRVKIGSEWPVRIDGMVEHLTGRVRYISSVSSFTPYYALSEENRSRLMYVTEVDLLDEKAKSLPLGTPVQLLLSQDK